MLCLASGADVDDADDEEFAPVYAAAVGGHSDIVHDCIVVGARLTLTLTQARAQPYDPNQVCPSYSPAYAPSCGRAGAAGAQEP